MKIAPVTQKKITEALASGEATEGHPAAIPMPSADLHKTPRRKIGSMPEEQFQRQVIDLARSRGWRVAHFRKVRVQRKDGSTYWETPVAADGKGFPDLLMVRDDRVLVAELKVPRNGLTPEQQVWLGAFNEANIGNYVWYPADWPQIKEVLR